MENPPLKKDWVLTPESFSNLLIWLDGSVDSAGENYLEMRRRLVSYFDRKNCLLPDDLADETLNRVSRRLEEEGTIIAETPAKYCYIVARFVFLETLRSSENRDISFETVAHYQSVKTHIDRDLIDEKERRLNCLEGCVGKLETVKRELIVKYYFGKERAKIENRRALAEIMGITVNALSIRACRIREKLEACVNECMSEK